MPEEKMPLLRPAVVIPLSALFRIALLCYGQWQDAHSPLKYTDVDYYVFTDAARYVFRGASPYQRSTYRYTPLVAWLLYPTNYVFTFGKCLFAAADMATGLGIYALLRQRGYDQAKSTRYASVWLLNPMVANISTRGSAESILSLIVIALLWAAIRRRVVLAAVLLGLATHMKIYPFIYAFAILWHWNASSQGFLNQVFNRTNVKFAVISLATFSALNLSLLPYGMQAVEHTFLYHLKRLDHRHNFSVWNTLLHWDSAYGDGSGSLVPKLAFLPQLLLAVVIVPMAIARKDLESTMLAQTVAFVTFNKVATSQYFVWYLVFLPLYLPRSVLVKRPTVGLAALFAWVCTQAAWLYKAFQLEFLGKSTFYSVGLAGGAFFITNCIILATVMTDVDVGNCV